MNLTQDDLSAIKQIVDDAIDDSKQHTAAGLDEVHSKIATLSQDIHEIKVDLNEVKSTVGRIENVQRAEVARVDQHSEDIAVLKQKFA